MFLETNKTAIAGPLWLSHSPSESVANTSWDNGSTKDPCNPDHSISEGHPVHYFKDFTRQTHRDLNPSKANRKAWTFLTMGIPLLIKTFSLFLKGIVHRETTGHSLQIRFNAKNIPPKFIDQIVKFQNINDRFSSAIDESERAKTFQIIERLRKSYEGADERQEKQLKDEIKPFLTLLEKCNAKCNSRRTIRKQFTADDWKVLDLVDFELLQDFFINLTDVFNSNWMRDSGLKNAIQEDFGVDYYEAVIAENLSLSLAYLEGIDNKKINIPALDAKTGRYVPVTYTIRESRLGDALPCYVLESNEVDADPWFVVRGSQTHTGLNADGKELRKGSLESILTNSIDPECITRNVINKALVSRPIVAENGNLVQKESLSDIFRAWRKNGRLVKLCGHSLGGILVNALTVEFYDQVKSTYAFSGAGISKETARKWEILKSKDKLKSYAYKLFNFDYEGDFIPSGGRRIIGNHYAMSCIEPNHKRGFYESHISSHLNRDFQIQRVDLKAENSKFSRSFMETIRIAVGRCFRLLLQFFSKNYIPDWWAKQREYQVYAAFERSTRFAV